MRRMIAFVIMLLPSGTAFGQFGTQAKRAEVATERENAFRRDVPPVPFRNPPDEVQIHYLLHMRPPIFAHQLTNEFFNTIYRTESLSISGDVERAKYYEQTRLQPLVKRLQQNAHIRIPFDATPEQREKLQDAATVDIRHSISELRASYKDGIPRLPERLQKAKDAGELDIFGTGSLFEKVMRQQGLLAN